MEEGFWAILGGVGTDTKYQRTFHTSETAAVNQATYLAKHNPGNRYYVMQAVRAFEAPTAVAEIDLYYKGMD